MLNEKVDYVAKQIEFNMKKKIVDLIWMTGIVFILWMILEYLAIFGFNTLSFLNILEILPGIALRIIIVFLVYATIIVLKEYKSKQK